MHIFHIVAIIVHIMKKQLMIVGAITTIEKPKEPMGAVALNYRMAFI